MLNKVTRIQGVWYSLVLFVQSAVLPWWTREIMQMYTSKYDYDYINNMFIITHFSHESNIKSLVIVQSCICWCSHKKQ